MTEFVVGTAFAASVIGVAWCLWMLVRNAQVYRFRTGLIRTISDCSRADISDGRDWRWRYESYERGPSYEDMMRRFWKPLHADAWFADTAFLKVGGRR